MGKRSNLIVFVSAVLFLVCDAAVLGLSYRIANQVEADATTINLAGRQRMLSQRMSKALLQVYIAIREGHAFDAPLRELDDAVELFDHTLSAFATGAHVRGSGGERVFQAALSDNTAADMVDEMIVAWQPYRYALGRVRNGIELSELAGIVATASTLNLDLLVMANALTTQMETVSRQRTTRLRYLQLTAFSIALVNFLVLVHAVWRRLHGLRHQHAEMARIASQDPLTGLPNRRYLVDYLEQAHGRLGDDQRGLVIGFVDLNHFKQVNDRFGHAAGDAVLVEVASRLRDTLRRSDLVARYGGDEFVIVLSELAHPADARRVLDSVVSKINQPVELDGLEVPVGLSVGAVFVDRPEASISHILCLADDLMYRVKSAGKRLHWELMRFDYDSDSLQALQIPVESARRG